MKINEIINEVGFLDKLKQVGGAVAGGVQSAVRSGQIRQIADMSSKTWIKMLGKIEAQKNDYQAMKGPSLAPYLEDWIDQTLLGSMSLKTASPEVKTAVANAVSKVSAQPRNRNMVADEFEKILNLSIASGKQDIGLATKSAQQTVDSMKDIANYNADTGQLTAKPGKEAELAQALKSMGLA